MRQRSHDEAGAGTTARTTERNTGTARTACDRTPEASVAILIVALVAVVAILVGLVAPRHIRGSFAGKYDPLLPGIRGGMAKVVADNQRARRKYLRQQWWKRWGWGSWKQQR
jgi:hypothetical protein